MKIEYRVGKKVVAAADTEVGVAFVAEVPVGTVDVFANGKPLGSGQTFGSTAADKDGHPKGGIHLSGRGCPKSAF